MHFLYILCVVTCNFVLEKVPVSSDNKHTGKIWNLFYPSTTLLICYGKGLEISYKVPSMAQGRE